MTKLLFILALLSGCSGSVALADVPDAGGGEAPCTCTTAPPAFARGPDDSVVLAPADLILVPRITAPRVWTMPTAGSLPAVRLFARDAPGASLELRRDDQTALAAFDGTGQAWLDLAAYDDGAGPMWFVTGWSGAITVPSDP